MNGATQRICQVAITVFLAAAATPAAHACATCFGESDSALAEGMTWGILSLIVVAYGVLFGIIGFFVFLARKSRMAVLEDESALSSHEGYNDYNDTERTEEEQTELCSRSS